MNNKTESFKEKLRQALSSTARVISDDLGINPKKNIISEYYQRCFGEELPESMINIQN